MAEKEYLLIEPAKFEKLLKMVSLPKAANPLIKTIEFDFDNKGLWVRQVDEAEVVAVLANFSPNYFLKYSILPSFQISAKSVLPDLRKVMKPEKVVKIFLDEDRIVFKGEYVEYSVLRLDSVLNKIEADTVVEYSFGFCATNLNPHKIFRLDISQLDLLKAEEITFEYGKTLTAMISMETKGYKRRLIHEANSGEGSGRVTLYYDIVEKIVKNMSGLIYLVFTEEGAVLFSQKRGTFTTTYIVFPVI
ncbi:MAG: hypothetical protein DRJ52_09310 [Thermoprotei archaeon]|nr:MAG: hypothetical protein DRJ52_09310 [Thermoprotei archaeon]